MVGTWKSRFMNAAAYAKTVWATEVMQEVKAQDSVISLKKGRTKGQGWRLKTNPEWSYNRHSFVGYNREGKPLVLIQRRMRYLHTTKGWRDRLVRQKLVAMEQNELQGLVS